MSLESPEPKPTLREIFLEATEMPSAAQREAYLRQVCGNDTRLRAKVDALLQSLQDDGFLERPAVEGSGTMFVSPAPLEGPGTVIGNYKLLEKLGEAASVWSIWPSRNSQLDAASLSRSSRSAWTHAKWSRASKLSARPWR